MCIPAFFEAHACQPVNSSWDTFCQLSVTACRTSAISSPDSWVGFSQQTYRDGESRHTEPAKIYACLLMCGLSESLNFLTSFLSKVVCGEIGADSKSTKSTASNLLIGYLQRWSNKNPHNDKHRVMLGPIARYE